MPDPSGPAAELGKDVDDNQLQPYLKTGRTFDYTRESGYIAATSLAYLPAPQSNNLEVQKHFSMPSPTWVDGEHVGFGYQGYIDLWLPRGGMPGIEGEVPVVCDFKTTGNWKYAKTEGQLATDVQAQIYATWAMYSTKSPIIDLVWLYMSTKGPRKAKKVHLRVTSDDVANEFLKINATALEIHEIKQTVTDPMDLPPNPAQCDAFGGCPYRHKCNLGPGEKIDAAAAQYARQHQVAEVTTMSNAGTAGGLLARLRQQKAAGNPVGGASGYELSEKQLDGQGVADAAVVALGINPPESKLDPAPAVGVVEAADPPKAKRIGRPRKAEEAAPVVVDAYEAAIEKEVQTTEEIARLIKIGHLVLSLIEACK